MWGDRVDVRREEKLGGFAGKRRDEIVAAGRHLLTRDLVAGCRELALEQGGDGALRASRRWRVDELPQQGEQLVRGAHGVRQASAPFLLGGTVTVSGPSGRT